MADVLLIDDDVSFLRDLAEGLHISSRATNVITADNAEKAIQILRTAVMDVIITDLNMPGINGFELIQRVQRQFPHIPVIIMSAYARTMVQDRLQGIRYAEYIEKPLDLAEIADAIRAVS